MRYSNNQKAFFALLQAGLWEKEVRLAPFGEVDFEEIMRLAEEQSVVGLITAGLERVTDVAVPKIELLQFIGQTLQIEEQNKNMNRFIASLIEKMRREDEIYALLIKGQGVAQCYERPLWRASGDIDLYLSNDNYEKAKTFLSPLASNIEPEDKRRLHFGMTIDSWIVELHGTMHTGLSRKMNKVSDKVYKDIFYGGNVRSWNNNGTPIFLPNANNDVIIVFNHFLSHFYGEGIGLRQICDWCRLLFCFLEKLDLRLLESRIRRMGLITEWNTFGTFAVEYLGMPVEAMPMFGSKLTNGQVSGSKFQVSSVPSVGFKVQGSKLKKKAERLCELILETGSFRASDDESYRKTSSKMKSNLITFQKRLKGFAKIASIFPVNAPKFFINYVIDRMRAVL